MANQILVTSALPYANGPIHFGHVLGAYLPADIYVRARRMMGDEVLYICGTDEHGVTIVQTADKKEISCQDSVDHWHSVIKQTFDQFQIDFDIFSGTSAGQNKFHAELSQEFFTRLNDNGYVNDRTIKQLYCTACQRFLADRYVEGTCPKCGYEEARGDECGSCGTWVDPLELKAPRCKQCTSAPEVKETRHWFLDLPKLKDEHLGAWFQQKEKAWKPNVKLFVENMLADLKDRPITRDLSWGVPVPLDAAKGKVLYVWFDAPIGYISATMQLFADRGDPDGWQKWWKNPDTEMVHFIGKDNIPFHVVVFPSMLYGVKDGYIQPENVPANEFYNLEGGKFSTSAGWYIPLDKFFTDFTADAARYALIASAPETKDSDFTWRSFQSRINNDLADNLGNLAARVLRFAERYMDGRIPGRKLEPSPDEAALLALRKTKVDEFKQAILAYQFRRATAIVMELSREANRVFDGGEPWSTRKTDIERAATTISVCAEVLRTLAFICAPLMPASSQKLWEMLGLEGAVKDLNFAAASNDEFAAAGPAVKAGILFAKVPDEQVAAEEDALKKRMLEATGVDPLGEEITFDDFQRPDLRVANILEAKKHPKADKLLVLTVDIGLEKRTICAGIADYYKPEELLGKQVIVVANLAPRKLRGVESQGMAIAASSKDGKTYLVHPGGEVPAGTRIS